MFILFNLRPPWEALEDLQSLQTLYLDGNQVKVQKFRLASDKHQLTVDQFDKFVFSTTFQITNLTKNAFGRLPVISYLGLSHNTISNISREAFENLRQLITLDLSFNNLTYVEPGAFVSKSSLTVVKLDTRRNGQLQFKQC